MDVSWTPDRIRLDRVLDAFGRSGLYIARDLAVDRDVWLLRCEGSRVPRGRIAFELRRLQLESIGAFALEEASFDWTEDPDGVCLVTAPSRGRPLVETIEDLPRPALERALREFRRDLELAGARGLCPGEWTPAQLWWSGESIRVLPHAWWTQFTSDFFDSPASEVDQAIGSLLAGMEAWLAERDLPRTEFASRAWHGSEAEVPADPNTELDRVLRAGGLVRIEARSAARAAKAQQRSLRSAGYRALLALPHNEPIDFEEAPDVLVLASPRSYVEFTAVWSRLERMRASDPAVVLVGEPGEDEALRLFLASRRARGFHAIEDTAAEGAAVLVEDPAAERVVDLLLASPRPLSASTLAEVSALDATRFAEVLRDLARSGVLGLSIVRPAKGRHAEVVVELLDREQPPLDPARREELRTLLAHSARRHSVRGGGLARLAWRGAVLRDIEPGEAAAALRRLALRAQKEGLALLAYSAWWCLTKEEPALPSTHEDAALSALCQSEQHRLRGEVSQARSILEAALARLRGEDGVSQALVAEVVLRQVQLDSYRSGFSEAEQRLQRLLHDSKEELPAELRARVYLDLAWAQVQVGRSRESIQTNELVLRILDPHEQPHTVARAHNQLGFALYRESEYGGSIVHYERALALRQHVGDELAVARTYNNLALSHRALGQWQEAQRCLQESLDRKRRAGDELSAAASLLNLGFVCLDRGDAAEAGDCAQQCLQIARNLGHAETEAEAWGLLGEVAEAEGRHEEALEHLTRDLEMCQSSGHQAELLATLRRVAAVMLSMGRTEDAAEKLELARHALDSQPSRYEAAMLDLLEGELLRDSGTLDLASDAFDSAVRGFASVRRTQVQLRALALRGLTDLVRGEHDRARAAGAEIAKLVREHEIHSTPEEVRELRRELEALPVAAEPLGAERALALLSAVAETVVPADFVSRVASGLGASEAYFVDEAGKAWRWREGGVVVANPVALPGEIAHAETRKIVRVDDTCWIRFGGETRCWMSLRRDREFSGAEERFLEVVAEMRGDRSLGPAGLDPASTAPDRETRVTDAVASMVGRSPAWREVLRTVEQVAQTEVIVLILGENGTGKELAARALHDASARSSGPFVAVNCASIPANLLESELFGHEKGAFTSAYERRIGRFEQANLGTLFLDEIAEMPLDMQAKLLRVLQERSFTRVGGSETLTTEARILAATNRDLRREVDEGRFRMDLFYRLNVVTIALPPLRDRVEDIAPLVDHFLRKHRDPGSESARTVTAEALARLEAYDWPGNVRELENLVRSALVFGTTQSLGLEDLPATLLSERRGSGPNLFELVREIVASEDWSEERPLLPRLELLLAHEAVKRLGNKTLAARRLGITKPTLYARLRRYDALFGESAEQNSGN